MLTTMRSIATGIASSPDYSGEVRLYVSSRNHESVYAVSEHGLTQTPYSDDILYLVNWTMLQGFLGRSLPRNILCTNAPHLEKPNIPEGCNILLLSGTITVEQLRDVLQQYGAGEKQQVFFAPQLLSAIYSGSLDKLCTKASALCGNPLIFFSFDFRVTAATLLHTENEDIIRIAETGLLSKEVINFLHDKRTLQRINAGEILEMPGTGTRFLCVPVMQNGVHISSILLFEDRVSIAEDDHILLSHVSKCFRLLHPGLNTTGPVRLIYEYALVRCLGDDADSSSIKTSRFNSMGYQIKSNLYMLVVNNVQPSVSVDLKQQLATISDHIRQVIGNHGLCTSFRDHVVVLLNLDSDAPLPGILKPLHLLCARNNLQIGLSPRFSNIEEVKRYYRYALDAIGIGSMIQPEYTIYNFKDLLIYKFISTCNRAFSSTDLIPEYLDTLMDYDRENNSNLLESLYYYVYTVKNTKKAAELMHVHRNTLLYRLDKIRSIIGVDPEDGDAFLQLMLSFKFLEFQAIQDGKELPFTPIHENTLISYDPEEEQ